MDDLVICPAQIFFELLFQCAEKTLMCCLLNACKSLGVCASRYSRRGLVVVLRRFSKLEKDYFGFESKYSHILGVSVCMKVQVRIAFKTGALLDEMSERKRRREAGHVCTCLPLTGCSVSAGVLHYLLLFLHSADSCSAARSGKRAREKSQYGR